MSELNAPPGMSKEAKTHFVRLVKEAGHRWENYHVDALVLYCETWIDVSRLRKGFRDSDSLIVESSNKQKQITPLWNAVKEGTKLLRELGVELGLSPVSEARNKLEKPEQTDEADPKLAEFEKKAAQRGKRTGK